MRVIAKKTLIEYWTKHPDTKHPDTEQPLRAWHNEVTKASWETPQDIKNQYASASFLSNNRVVFNIRGNNHRLVVGIAYQLGVLYIKFVGTHAEYDKINANTI